MRREGSPWKFPHTFAHSRCYMSIWPSPHLHTHTQNHSMLIFVYCVPTNLLQTSGDCDCRRCHSLECQQLTTGTCFSISGFHDVNMPTVEWQVNPNPALSDFTDLYSWLRGSSSVTRPTWCKKLVQDYLKFAGIGTWEMFHISNWTTLVSLFTPKPCFIMLSHATPATLSWPWCIRKLHPSEVQQKSFLRLHLMNQQSTTSTTSTIHKIDQAKKVGFPLYFGRPRIHPCHRSKSLSKASWAGALLKQHWPRLYCLSMSCIETLKIAISDVWWLQEPLCNDRGSTNKRSENVPWSRAIADM